MGMGFSLGAWFSPADFQARAGAQSGAQGECCQQSSKSVGHALLQNLRNFVGMLEGLPAVLRRVWVFPIERTKPILVPTIRVAVVRLPHLPIVISTYVPE